MPKTDLVPVYYPESSQSNPPDAFKLREEVRAWKKAGMGYFVSHGTIFQLSGKPEVGISWEELLRAFDIRGASTKIDEPTNEKLGMMSRFVMGDARAIAAVESYRWRQHA